MLLALSGIIALQSCKKYTSVPFVEHHAFTTPSTESPANEAVVHTTGSTVDLTWVSTNPDGTATKADVYFGTSEDPELYAEGLTATTLNVPIEIGLTYFWRVVMIDVNNVTVDGPTWTFSIFEPIAIFVGSFTADEPAEAYTYPISFTKFNDNTLKTANYWNSGWVAYFNLNFTGNTYSMDSTAWGGYSGIEAGTIDPVTGTMIGDYKIYNGALGTPPIEVGVHTYTKN